MILVEIIFQSLSGCSHCTQTIQNDKLRDRIYVCLNDDRAEHSGAAPKKELYINFVYSLHGLQGTLSGFPSAAHIVSPSKMKAQEVLLLRMGFPEHETAEMKNS